MQKFPVLLSLFFLLGLATSVISKKNGREDSSSPLRVIFLHGGKSHALGAHEFRAGSIILANQLSNQNAVPVEAIVIAGWPEDPSILETADTIVIYNDSTKIVRHGWDKLDALTKKGTGIMLMHYATHPKVEEGEQYFLPWVGGYFHNDQSVNPFWLANIQPLAGHPTSKGIGEIHAIDEFYYNLTYHADALPLGTATPTKGNLKRINNLWRPEGEAAIGTPQKLLWGYERPGGGRGAGFTGGHYHHNWAHDELRQLVLNTIIWTAGGPIPEEGIPVQEVTEEMLNENLDNYGPNPKRIPLPKDPRQGFTPGNYLTSAEHTALREKLKAERRKEK